jgi:hypothetical protein
MMVEITMEMLERHKKNWNNLESTLKIYKEIGRRNLYLFDWLLFAWENVLLSCVDPKYANELSIVKTKIAIIDTLIDDIADLPQEHPKHFFEEYMKLPLNKEDIKIEKLDEKQRRYIEKCDLIWKDILNTVKNFPRYEEFRDAFEFDIRQVLNSMRFAYLINSNPLVNNIVENRTYGHHGMTVIACRMLDLMCSLKFDKNELPYARKTFYLTQQYMRLGNMINTYPREIDEQDVSNEPFTLIMERETLKKEELHLLKTDKFEGELIETIGECICNGDNILEELKETSEHIKSFDTEKTMNEIDQIYKLYEQRAKYWLPEYKNKLFSDEHAGTI